VSPRPLARLAVLSILLLSPPGDLPAAPNARPSLCAVRHPSDALVEWTCRRLRNSETLERLFGDRWIDVARFNRVDRRHATPGVELKIPARLEDIRDFTPMPAEDSEPNPPPRLIVVDLAEQFLGAYEHGRRVFSAPVTTGDAGHPTPTGRFAITAVDRSRGSSLYMIEGTTMPYPMNYALRFLVDAEGVAFWIHGRDVPGYAASHGCIGLYDEHMQRNYYGQPRDPVLADARTLYVWVLDSVDDGGGFRVLRHGPRVRIVGTAPRATAPDARPPTRSSASAEPPARGCRFSLFESPTSGSRKGHP